MKKWIHASTDLELTNQGMIDVLNEAGIDTTKAKYELKAERYERHGGGSIYIKKFTCPGDYLAYFSMTVHKAPTADAISESYYIESLDEFKEFVEEVPTKEAMLDTASSSWWGDGDDYILYLKNLTTGEYLYGPQEQEEYEEYEEEWED